MFIGLLALNVVVSFLVALAVALVFRGPISRIMARLVAEDIAPGWTGYLTFAIFVVGVSGGVQVWALERYLGGGAPGTATLRLTGDRMALDVYRTIIGTLTADAWMLLVFFLFALIAYVIVRGFDARREREE